MITIISTLWRYWPWQYCCPHLSVSLSVLLSVCLCVCVSVCVSVCLFVCLSFLWNGGWRAIPYNMAPLSVADPGFFDRGGGVPIGTWFYLTMCILYILAWNHLPAFSRSFPMIPNTWWFGLSEDDCLHNIVKKYIFSGCERGGARLVHHPLDPPLVVIHCLPLIKEAMPWGQACEGDGRYSCFQYAKTYSYFSA